MKTKKILPLWICLEVLPVMSSYMSLLLFTYTILVIFNFIQYSLLSFFFVLSGFVLYPQLKKKYMKIQKILKFSI